MSKGKGQRSKVVRAATVVLFVCVAYAENWPQWRGPNLNGVSGEKNPPLRWSATENISWKLATPSLSGATPILWGDRIFLNVAEGDDLYIWCVDRNKGTVLWKQKMGGGNHMVRKQNMSSPSPVTDGRTVWMIDRKSTRLNSSHRL